MILWIFMALLAGATVVALVTPVMRAPISGNFSPHEKLGWGLAMAVPLVAVALYLALGRPMLPDAPLASRPSSSPETPPMPDVNAMMERLRQKLAQNPDDLGGWLMLARSYKVTGRPAESAEALRHALALQAADPDLQTLLGETLIEAADGQVTDEAMAMFGAALSAKPDHLQALYYQALGEAQRGHKAKAKGLWRQILGDTRASDELKAMVDERIKGLGF